MSHDSSVWTFLSHFQSGFGKPNRYRVEFLLPRGVAPGAPGSAVDISPWSMSTSIGSVNQHFNGAGGINIKAHTVTLPQRSMMTYPHKQNSAPWNIPYSSSYDPITISMYGNSAYDTRQFFEVWQATVTNFSTNTMNFLDEYSSDIHIYALDTAGNDTYGVTLFEAWPINVGVVDLSYSQNDNFLNVIVTMSYKYWLPHEGGSGTATQRTT